MAVHRGVYLLGGATLTWGAREVAAVLAVGESAFLSHHGAAYRLRLLPYPAHYPEVEITTARRGPATRPGIRVHRVARLASGETLVLDGLPLTTVRRTLLDLAAVASDRGLERALATALATRRITRRGLLTYLEDHRRRPGTGRLRRWIEAGAKPAFTRSDAEELLLALIRTSALPEPEFNAPVGRFEVDAWWAPQRLVVEVDGWRFHGDQASAERDSARDAELAGFGVRVIRVSWRQLVNEPDRVRDRIRNALGASMTM
jgi:very-short-patch-repair endonuclease